MATSSPSRHATKRSATAPSIISPTIAASSPSTCGSTTSPCRRFTDRRRTRRASNRRLRSGEQQLQVLPAEAGEQAPVGLDDGVGEVALGGLKLQDFLLDRIAGDDSAGKDGPLLPDAVGAVDRLGLHGRIPPWVQEVHVVGGGQVETQSAGLETDQEQGTAVPGLERRHLLGAVAGTAVEILVRKPPGVELLAQDGEEAGELGEDQRLVPLLEDLAQLGEEEVELGARLAQALRVHETRVARRLAQAQQR